MILGWHPFNVTLEPGHSIVFSVQAISWLLMGYHYLLVDVFWYSVIFLTIGQLQIIAHSYRYIVPQQDPDEEDSKELPPYTQDVLFKCVRQHQLVRRLVRKTEF